MSMLNQFLLSFISRKNSILGILNMMFIIGASINLESFSNNDFKYTAPSIANEESWNNYHLSVEKNKSVTNNDRLLTIKKREISRSKAYSSFQSKFPLRTYFLPLRIRKRDDFEESADDKETSKPEYDDNEEVTEPESIENGEKTGSESDENRDEPTPESGKNDEESDGNEEASKPEFNENAEVFEPQSDKIEKEWKPETGENEKFKSVSDENEQRPMSESDQLEGEPELEFDESKDSHKPELDTNEENVEIIPPSPIEEFSPPDTEEERKFSQERQTEKTLSFSASNLGNSRIIPMNEWSDFEFQKKSHPSDILQQKEEPESSQNQKGKLGSSNKLRVTASALEEDLDTETDDFLPEDLDEDSFNPRSFPTKKFRTLQPPQPVVSWNEFLIMQDKFQKMGESPKPFPNNKLNPSFPKSKDKLQSFVEEAIKRNKQIEMELLALKQMLENNTPEQKTLQNRPPQFDGIPRPINNTLQLNVPLLPRGRVGAQEFKIKIEAEAPLKIKTQVGDAVRSNSRLLRLVQRSGDANMTSTNKIQVREIETGTKTAEKFAVSRGPVGISSSTIAGSRAEDYDPLKAERGAFIRKGAEILRLLWYKYKLKRHPSLQ